MWNPRAFKGQVSPHEFMQVGEEVGGRGVLERRGVEEETV
jgi:hypothetical protein